MQDSYWFIDGVQTAGIVAIACVLIYVVIRLDRALTVAAVKLTEMINRQNQLDQSIHRAWERIDAMEMRQGVNGDAEMLARMRRFMEAFEASNKT